MSFDFIAFGTAAHHIARDARKLSRDAHLARVYVRDTARAAGQADYDLQEAAACLEDAAADLRILVARIEQMRRDQSFPALAAE